MVVLTGLGREQTLTRRALDIRGVAPRPYTRVHPTIFAHGYDCWSTGIVLHEQDTRVSSKSHGLGE